MSSDIAIKVSNVSKHYQIYDRPSDRLKQSFYRGRKQFYREFKALEDVSFEIGKGETVGIIGRNGSGKSTMLQIICGTLTPTSGSVETYGRVAALLELGSGFNPEFTGWENVRMSCALLGLTPDETEDRLDAIAAFADIGDFIEQPVKTYSSGMYVRLAFAVNAFSDPDIMVVDEALSVGDISFQAKCMTVLNRIQNDGAAVLFVSHDVNTVKSLCSRGIYLESGIVKSIGKAADVAELYIRNMREEMNEEQRKISSVSTGSDSIQKKTESGQSGGNSNAVFKHSEEFDTRVAEFRYGSGGVSVAYVELLNSDNEEIKIVDFNQSVKIRIYIEATSEQSVTVNFYILDDKKINVTGCGFSLVKRELLQTENGGHYLVEYSLNLPLQEGNYSIRVQVTAPIIGDQSAEFLDVVEDAVVFQMVRWEVARVWSKIHLFPTLTLERLP